MYKALLVDDEALIREAISENTNWNELGFTLIGACKNGKEAVEFIKNDPPDLLLTDICMPYMDGMELAEFVCENYKGMNIIIISGYDDFEYAKKAVRYQVVDYILKPVTAKELSEILKNVREKLDAERCRNADMNKIRSAYIRNLPLLRNRFLNSLLRGEVTYEKFSEKIRDYDIVLDGPCFVTAMIEGDDVSEFVRNMQDKKVNLEFFAIFNIAEEIMKQSGNGIAFQNMEEKTILIFEGRENIARKALESCEKIQRAILEFLKIKTTIGLGTVVDDITRLPESFEETMRAVSYKFQLGTNRVISADSMEKERAFRSIPIKSYANEIVLGMKMNREEDIRNGVQEFIKDLRDRFHSRHQSIFYIQNMILTIIELSGSTGLDERAVSDSERQLLNNLFEKEHLSEIAEDMVVFCTELAEKMNEEREGLCKRQAWMAQNYIEDNYWDSSISLNSVCSYLSISTSYFSAIFKKYTGETFIEALTKKRIEKAKQLIETTSKKTYEIAGEVGYSDPHYFSSIFKKMTGITPTEYAKKRR